VIAKAAAATALVVTPAGFSAPADWQAAKAAAAKSAHTPHILVKEDFIMAFVD
jgi:hypothetical protein